MVGRLAAPLFLFCLVEGFVHTSNRKKYFFRVWVLAAPMGLLLFFMRYGGWFTRPDGFYPENSMLSTFVLLLLFYQGFEWIASRRASKVVLGLALVVFLVLWPQLAGRCTLLFPQTATVFGVLGYAVLPMMNFTGDLSLPVILVGLALYFAKRSRIAQVIALNVVSFGWHFVLVYLQVRTWPDFQMVQMFTTYYEWMGGLLATPLLLCYNGQRGAGVPPVLLCFLPRPYLHPVRPVLAPSPGHGLKKGGSIMAHILVVDDDADLRQLLLTALERDGHQVTALDRGSAVTEAHCRWAHCILLDVMMPGEDGFATCQRVRALADCPILFLTAKTEEADVIQGLGLGGDDYLTKLPFAVGELRARVAAHLRRQHRTPSTGSAGAAWILTWGRRRFTGESSR